MKLLDGKRLLITGVVTTDSIAFAVARRAMAEGASVALTTFHRDRERTVAAASELPSAPPLFELDVTDETHVGRLTANLRDLWGGLDGALHAVEFAPRSALSGAFLDADREAVQRAFDASTYSYAAVARVLDALAPRSGGSLVGLDFDAAGAWPVYNWTGVCKSALESTSRYVARDLGARCIRSNLIPAGPLHTRAAGGIPEFERLTAAWDARAPLTWDPLDSGPVADAACFLLSDLGRGITGEILHVDGGFHAMAADLRAEP